MTDPTPLRQGPRFLNLLGRLKLAQYGLGVQSLQRGLNWEHGAVERDTARMEQAMHTNTGVQAEADMGDLNLGDTTVHQHLPASQSSLKSVLIGAALGAAGLAAAGPLADYYFGSRQQPVPVQTNESPKSPDNDTRYTLDFEDE